MRLLLIQKFTVQKSWRSGTVQYVHLRSLGDSTFQLSYMWAHKNLTLKRWKLFDFCEDHIILIGKVSHTKLVSKKWAVAANESVLPLTHFSRRSKAGKVKLHVVVFQEK